MQQKIHWLAEEVPMGNDVRDWETKMTPEEKNLVTQILRFFVQGDVSVADAYLDYYIPYFKPVELRMMMAAFASSETIHIQGYSHLIDTLGLPESEYTAFLDYAEMKAKYDFMKSFNPESPEQVALTLAAFGAGVEGTQLFSSFAVLMSFPRQNKLNGLGQIVTWSSRDEDLHSTTMARLFKEFMYENRIPLNTLKNRVYDVMRTCVELEDNFINRAFELGPVKGLTSEELKAYIRFTANKRLRGLGYEPIYLQNTSNPLPWMDEMLQAQEHANFFEQRSTAYTKAASGGSWGDVW